MLLAVSRKKRQFSAHDRGSVAIILGAVLPVLALLVGGTLDFVRYNSLRSDLQSAADAASLAAAREITLADSSKESLSNVAETIVGKFVDAQKLNADGKPLITTTLRNNPREVDVAIELAFKSMFAKLVGFQRMPIGVRSVARIVGSPNICVLALEERETAAVSLNVTSRITGNDCGIFSNSRSESGISVLAHSGIEAETVCSAGGVLGGDGVKPEALVDCPQFKDPLAERPEPEIGECDHKARIITLSKVTIQPGVYCFGLTILAGEVHFAPGVYIIRDGVFTVEGLARITGEDVSIFLGPKATLLWGPTSSVQLSASRDGPLAGLLLFGSREQATFTQHLILSRFAQSLTGTIYLPKASLVIDGDAKVGSDAAYTAIVSRRLVLLASPHVVLNARYAETDVPVPEGIRASGRSVSLVK